MASRAAFSQLLLLESGADRHDQDQAALDAIMAEWSRSDADYGTRANNLFGGLLAEGLVTSNGQQHTLRDEGARDTFFASDLDVLDSNDPGELVASSAAQSCV